MSKIQLYSLATPNGIKVSIALEEMGLEYDAHKINILEGDQFRDEFVKINPNSKIPAIIDADGHIVIESGAILLHLAEKTGMFLSKDPVLRSETIQWLFFQVGNVGPMFGQFGHFFRYSGDKCDHPYPLERYSTEVRRLLSVLNKRLEDRSFLVGENYSIADMATFPWVECLEFFYKASSHLNLKEFEHVNRWLEEIDKRPATAKGRNVCPI